MRPYSLAFSSIEAYTSDHVSCYEGSARWNHRQNSEKLSLTGSRQRPQATLHGATATSPAIPACGSSVNSTVIAMGYLSGSLADSSDRAYTSAIYGGGRASIAPATHRYAGRRHAAGGDNAEVNSDGRGDAIDAALILQYSAGLLEDLA